MSESLAYKYMTGYIVTSETLPQSSKCQLQASSYQNLQAARTELRPHVCSK